MASALGVKILSDVQKQVLNQAGKEAMHIVRGFYKDGKMPYLGDRFVFELNDCILILDFDGNIFQCSFFGGKPIKIDFETGVFNENGEVITLEMED